MTDSDFSQLEQALDKESTSEQAYLISLYLRLVGLEPGIRRSVEGAIGACEIHMQIPNTLDKRKTVIASKANHEGN